MESTKFTKLTIISLIGLIAGIGYGYVWLYHTNVIWQFMFSIIVFVIFFTNVIVEKEGGKKIISLLGAGIWYIIVLLDLIEL